MLPAIIARFRAHRRYVLTVGQLSALSDHELGDIGVRRPDIERLARGTSTASARALPAKPAIGTVAYAG